MSYVDSRHKHPLTKLVRTGQRECDECEKVLEEKDSYFSCQQCEYDMCIECVFKRRPTVVVDRPALTTRPPDRPIGFLHPREGMKGVR